MHRPAPQYIHPHSSGQSSIPTPFLCSNFELFTVDTVVDAIIFFLGMPRIWMFTVYLFPEFSYAEIEKEWGPTFDKLVKNNQRCRGHTGTLSFSSKGKLNLEMGPIRPAGVDFIKVERTVQITEIAISICTLRLHHTITPVKSFSKVGRLLSAVHPTLWNRPLGWYAEIQDQFLSSILPMFFLSKNSRSILSMN